MFHLYAICLVEPPIHAGAYVDSGAMLKIRVEIAYPLVTPAAVAAKTDIGVTNEVSEPGTAWH